MQSPQKSSLVQAKLDEVEAEMKRIGFWSDNPPAFTATSFLDAPSFELWLQCVFIPNARKVAASEKWPDNSQVGLMAQRQYDYHSFVAEAQNLLKLLHEFDELVTSGDS